MSSSVSLAVIAVVTLGLVLAALLAGRSETVAAERVARFRAAPATDGATPTTPKSPQTLSPILAGLALVGVGAFIFFANRIDRSPQTSSAAFSACTFAVTAPLEVAAGDTFTVDLKANGQSCPALADASLYVNGGDHDVHAIGAELTFSDVPAPVIGRRWEVTTTDAGVRAVDIVVRDKASTNYLASFSVDVKQAATLSSVTTLLTNGTSLLAALAGILVALIGYLRGRPITT